MSKKRYNRKKSVRKQAIKRRTKRRSKKVHGSRKRLFVKPRWHYRR